jgi:hypothetical protein
MAIKPMDIRWRSLLALYSAGTLCRRRKPSTEWLGAAKPRGYAGSVRCRTGQKVSDCGPVA